MCLGSSIYIHFDLLRTILTIACTYNVKALSTMQFAWVRPNRIYSNFGNKVGG